jgi:hypothetical protein
MSWQTWVLVILIVLLALAQYTLMAYALRDLLRRPRVRGDNKVLWALVILALPFAGALIYSVYGPTSFLPRANRPPSRPPGWEQRDLPESDR